jgi:hypothetical protein
MTLAALLEHRVSLLVTTVALVAATLVSACGGSNASGGVEFPTVVTLGKGDYFPSIVNHSLGVGPNRVSISLTDRSDQKVFDAVIHVQFYDLNGDKPVMKSESDARFFPVELSYIDEQAEASTPAGRDGVYVVNTDFDEVGQWGMAVTLTRNGKTEKPIPFRFQVLSHTPEPAIGDPAPPSRQATLQDVSDISEIDSSYPPRPSMHNMTVADALATHVPIVLAFATPAFCQTRICAPVMDTVMDPLAAQYAGRVNFIHIEPYDLKDLRASNVQVPVPATQEWRIQDEPWVFVIDRSGHIAAKFEGIAAFDEVDAAVQHALSNPP